MRFLLFLAVWSTALMGVACDACDRWCGDQADLVRECGEFYESELGLEFSCLVDPETYDPDTVKDEDWRSCDDPGDYRESCTAVQDAEQARRDADGRRAALEACESDSLALRSFLGDDDCCGAAEFMGQNATGCTNP